MQRDLATICHKKRLLIVDDDPDFVYLIQRAFRNHPKIENITCATNGAEAIEILKNSSVPGEVPCPDFVLLDINMPVMNGFEFLDRYQMLMRQIPVLNKIVFFVISSSNSPEDRAMVSKYEVVKRYLLKPTDFNILTAVMGI